jgi:hypothetical protein
VTGRTILPTHSCFDDSLDLIELRVKAKIADADVLVLVHGICTAPDGDPYAHAWVEENGLAWDSGLLDGEAIYYVCSVEEFTKARGVQKTTRYTVREALIENYRTNMYGPWEPEYLALCHPRGALRVFGPLT